MDFNQRRQLRNELRDIQRELREPLPPEAHLIRKLKGDDLYIYLNWEAIRAHLDDIVPDYELSIQQPVIDYQANLAIAVGTLTICGVSKQALGSVPISEKSSQGKEMMRGDCVDRVHAEVFKNCAEAWGVGRYIGDQQFCLKYLKANLAAIPEDYRNKLNVIASQIQQKLRKGEAVSMYGTSETARQVTPTTESTDLLGAMNGDLKPKPKAITSTPRPSKPRQIAGVPIADPPQQPAPQQQQEQQPLDPGLYPQHNTIINQAANIANVSKGWIRDYLGRSREGLKPEHINPDSLLILLEAIAVQGFTAKYQDAKACRAAYRAKLAVLAPEGSGLTQAVKAFELFCEQSAQLTAPVLSGGRSN
jgi:hypothetical protein